MFIARAMCGLTYVTVTALWSSCSLQKYLERWPAALYVAGLSVLMLMIGSKIPRIELNTVRLYEHYSLSMHNQLQYIWREDYCECVRPAQIPRLNPRLKLRPSWNNIHDTFPTGTAQDTTIEALRISRQSVHEGGNVANHYLPIT